MDSIAEHWDLEIKPKDNLFDLHLKDVWNYRDLLGLLVRRDFVAKYKQTILGPLWNFIQPIMSTLVSLLLFNVIANISVNGTNPFLFQLSGIIIWNYFSSCINGCSSVFVTNAGVFGKVYFPRLIMPLSIIISSLVQLGIQFLLLVFAAAFFYFIKGQPIYFGWTWLLAPIYILLMAGIGLGLGILISSVTTKYRDMTVLMTFGIQLLMYASAVNYPLSYLEEKNKTIFNLVKWNPLAVVVDDFRNALLTGHVNISALTYPFCFTVISLFLGTIFFNKVEKSFMDTV